MAILGHDNTHSRVVAWLKIVLPLLALAILSTLFLVSRTIDPSDAIPYATVDVEDRAREPRMVAPEYAGVTTDGAALTLTADQAKPDAATGATAAAVQATLQTPDGASTTFTAAAAAIDTATQQLHLSGGVTIATSQGYTIQADALSAALDRTQVASDGRLTATAPMGNLTAGAMTISQDAANSGQYLLVFTKGVKLIYTPAK